MFGVEGVGSVKTNVMKMNEKKRISEMATNKIAISKIISSSNRKTERWRLAAVLLGIAIVGAGCAQKAVPEGEMQMEVQ